MVLSLGCHSCDSARVLTDITDSWSLVVYGFYDVYVMRRFGSQITFNCKLAWYQLGGAGFILTNNAYDVLS